MRHRRQHRIAVSRYTLPLTLAYAIAIWFIGGLIGKQMWFQFSLMLIATLVVAELNNRHAIMRTYTRTMSCSFLLMNMAILPVFYTVGTGITQLCFVTALLFLFWTYQDKASTSSTFIAFLLLSVASFWMIQLLYLVPIFWLIMRVYLLGLSWRTFWASLLGLVTPYWLVGGYFVYTKDISDLSSHFLPLFAFHDAFNFQTISIGNKLAFVLFVLMGIIGTIHFLYDRSKDKIRIRLLFYSFIMMSLFITALIIVQPTLFNQLLPLLIVATSPLIAHYVTFTDSRISAIVCLVLLLAMMVLTGFQLWGY